jgi:hypothetical protein
VTSPCWTSRASRSAGAERTLEVRGRDGELRRTAELPVGQQLDGAAAWSPDSELLAVSSAVGIGFLDAVDGSLRSDLDPGAAGTTASATGTPQTSGRVLGWTSPVEVVVLSSSGGPSPADPTSTC